MDADDQLAGGLQLSRYVWRCNFFLSILSNALAADAATTMTYYSLYSRISAL